jgi:HEAT repeat-containing protein 5
MFVSSLKWEQKGVGMGAIMPMLLERANKEGEESYEETSARLLELASADQVSFRGVVGGMTEVQRGFMESVITKGRQTASTKGSGQDNSQGREPTIALRMDFGS